MLGLVAPGCGLRTNRPGLCRSDSCGASQGSGTRRGSVAESFMLRTVGTSFPAEQFPCSVCKENSLRLVCPDRQSAACPHSADCWARGSAASHSAIARTFVSRPISA